MATTPNQTYPLMTLQHPVKPDFIDLADDCDEYASLLIDNKDAAERRVICHFLHTSLSQLRPMLYEAIPAHLVATFTVDTLPERTPRFEPEADQLCDYCLALSALLHEASLPPALEKTVRGLLCDLVWFFAEEMHAPRWLRTEDGVTAIVS
ncbi:hypothetical protein KXR87_06190 [Yokenella regensburgei]|uniref:hypothetical protein n=1 Tax=Yokenella regensburgei TaxID=158877 RepID=UPI003F134C48